MLTDAPRAGRTAGRIRTTCPALLLIRPHAMRAPALPAGWVVQIVGVLVHDHRAADDAVVAGAQADAGDLGW